MTKPTKIEKEFLSRVEEAYGSNMRLGIVYLFLLVIEYKEKITAKRFKELVEGYWNNG